MPGEKRSRLLNIAKKMPPLKHSIPGEEFDIQNSEVLKWILQNPEAWNYIWNNIKQAGVIVFDSATETWQGVDYDGDKKQYCSTCDWYETFSGICSKGNSEHCADFCDPDDTCNKWCDRYGKKTEEVSDGD